MCLMNIIILWIFIFGLVKATLDDEIDKNKLRFKHLTNIDLAEDKELRNRVHIH